MITMAIHRGNRNERSLTVAPNVSYFTVLITESYSDFCIAVIMIIKEEWEARVNLFINGAEYSCQKQSSYKPDLTWEIIFNGGPSMGSMNDNRYKLDF
jgi:hypothetical protein